jgi:hypothetical protein
MKTLTEKQQRWSTIIEDWSHSGLSQAEYCRQHQLNLDQFYAWKYKLAKANHQPKDKAEFLPLTVIQNADTAASIILCVAGVEIRYEHDTDPELLTQLLCTLRVVS